MRRIKFVIVILAVIALAANGLFVRQAEARLNYLCINQIVIYAQDISGYTPGGDNDTAIINDRNGNLLVKVRQRGDDKVVWPKDYFVALKAGDLLRYTGWNNDFLRVDILDVNFNFLEEITYQKERFDVVHQIFQDGYVKFTGGEKALEYNYLLICPSSVIAPPTGGVNRSPVWSQLPTQFGRVNQFLQFSVSATDPDGDQLSYSAFNLPSGASFDNTNRIFSWTPSSSQAGTYGLIFRVSDGNLSADMTVSISISSGGAGSQNRPPVWSPIGSQNAFINQQLQFSVFASDPDGDSLSYSAFGLPSGVSWSGSNLFFWTPSSSQTGVYTVIFRVTDSFYTVDMPVTINVSGSPYYPPPPYYPPFNQPPIWSPIGSQSVTAGQLLQFYVFANDPNGDYLNYTAFNLPSGATFNSFTRLFSWVPASSQIGNYTVTFRAADSQTSVNMTVPITVYASGSGFNPPPPPNVSQAPQFLNFNPPLVAVEGQRYSYAAYAIGAAPITYRLRESPAGMTIDPVNSLISWVPAFFHSESAPYRITVEAANSYGTDSETYLLSVLNVPPSGSIQPPPQIPPAPVPPQAPRPPVVSEPIPVEPSPEGLAGIFDVFDDIPGSTLFFMFVVLILAIILYLTYRKSAAIAVAGRYT